MENFRITTVAQLSAVGGRAVFDENRRLKILIIFCFLIGKFDKTVLIGRIDKIVAVL